MVAKRPSLGNFSSFKVIDLYENANSVLKFSKESDSLQLNPSEKEVSVSLLTERK